MNAGASGKEIKDLVVSIRYLDLNTLEIEEVPASQAGFGYRQSIFQGDRTRSCCKHEIQLATGDPDRIWEEMEAMRKARWAKQPRDWPSAGSVFKRPLGKYVGPMIEELGLKGHESVAQASQRSMLAFSLTRRCDGSRHRRTDRVHQEPRQRGL